MTAITVVANVLYGLIYIGLDSHLELGEKVRMMTIGNNYLSRKGGYI